MAATQRPINFPKTFVFLGLMVFLTLLTDHLFGSRFSIPVAVIIVLALLINWIRKSEAKPVRRFRQISFPVIFSILAGAIGIFVVINYDKVVGSVLIFTAIGILLWALDSIKEVKLLLHCYL